MRHDPRTEAFERLGGRYDVRVLEPSPPAVAEGPWFADDPAARGEVPAGRTLVSPVSSGDLTWDDLARDDRDLAAWCADRWLGAWRRLAPLPDRFVSCREVLHGYAEGTLKPARDEQLRVEGAALVRVEGGDEASREAIGGVSAEAVAALGDWYGFVTSVLEELRARAAPELEPSRVQLWPEHFDVSTELGAEAAGARAGYGGSPGDDGHDEPYLYVVPWTAEPEGELWSAEGFVGAELPYADLLAADDQRATALDFFATRLRALIG
jgi:hypothetical protein